MSESNKSGEASVGVDKAPSETKQVQQEQKQQVPAPQSTQSKQELVDAAVKFMLDPKVSNAPMAKKMAFLESKGLSPDDIQQVMKIVYSQSSPSAISEQSNVQSYNASSQPPPLPQYPSNAAAAVVHQPYPGPSLYNSRARIWVDMFIVSAFASSLVVAGCHAVQKYFGQSLPQWMRLTEGKDTVSSDVEQNWEAAIDKAMERHIAQTQNQIKAQMESQISQLQSSLSDLIERQNVSNNNNNNNNTCGDEFDAQDVVLKVNEVKSEIKSLKALLLSRKSFAAMPQSSPAIVVTSSTSAAAASISDSAMVDDNKPTLADNAQVSSMLPKWQMEDDTLDQLDNGESTPMDESHNINKEYSSDDPIKNSLVMQSEQ
ncbi:hypothetical protein MP228_003880 [Amoeboaphelidium protococcarum]|nr:hypothetical protein MP228_003880 [Amoeboaphelidium protococcarum]